MRTPTQGEEGKSKEVRIMQPGRVKMWFYTKFEYAPHCYMTQPETAGKPPEEPAETQIIGWKALMAANLYEERSPYISVKAVERQLQWESVLSRNRIHTEMLT